MTVYGTSLLLPQTRITLLPSVPPQIAKQRDRKFEEERDEDIARARKEEEEAPTDPAERKLWEEARRQAADLAMAVDSLGLGGKAAGKSLAAGADAATCIDALPLSHAASFRDAGARIAARVCRDGITTGSRGSSELALDFFREALKTGAERCDAWGDYQMTFVSVICRQPGRAGCVASAYRTAMSWPSSYPRAVQVVSG